MVISADELPRGASASTLVIGLLDIILSPFEKDPYWCHFNINRSEVTEKYQKL